MFEPWYLLAVVAALLLAGPSSSVAQESRTQQVQLEQGWNLVSLNVQPDDSSFASIFGANDDQIAMIKNEEGEVYAPGEGIEQITTWKSGEGYQVHANTALTLGVSGTAIQPSSTPIMLEEGGNIVPYLSATAQGAEAAFESIDESMILAVDEDGNEYNPSLSSPPLDSLHPGQAYKIYVSKADTLRYPIVVPTLAEAKGLEGVEVGGMIQIQGYHEPGDGGGGLFKVTDSGAETDGGTVFAFDEDVSSQQSEQHGDEIAGESLSQSDIVWGTVEVEIDGTPNERIVDNRFLHGHTTSGYRSQGQHIPMLDHGTGEFADRASIGAVRSTLDGSGLTARYKYATSSRRLERMGVSNAVSIDWWGATEADPDDPVNNWWRIDWAINKAKEMYENKNLEWAYVDIPGHYYYRYLIRIQDGVRLRGASDQYDSKPTQTFQDAANGTTTYGKLSIMPGMAMNHTKDGYSQNHLHTYLRVANIDLTHAYMTSKVGMESLEVDGNIQNNLAPIKNTDGKYNNVQKKLQTANNWNGFMSRSNNEAWVLPDGAVADFDDVYIHDFPGNGISGQRKALDFDPSKNVRVKDAPRNHVLYRTAGLHDSWQIEGAGWASLLKVVSGTFPNLSINVGPNELNQYWSNISWRKVFDHHGKDFGKEWDDIQNLSDFQIDVDNFDIDLTNAPDHGRYPNVMVFPESGYGGTYKDGTITTASYKSTTLFEPQSTEGNGPIRDYTYQNITVTDNGGGVTLTNLGTGTHLKVDGLTIQSGRSTTPDRNLFRLASHPPSTYSEYNGDTIARRMPMAARFDISGLETQPRKGFPFNIAATNGEHPINLFVSGSTIDNSPSAQDSRFFGPATGAQADVWRLFLSNTGLNARPPEPSYRDEAFHKYLLNPEKTIRLRNCTSPRTNRVSDDSGTFTSSASDEGNDYVVIPTNLMSLSQETSATITSGNRTVQSVENADGNGNVQTWDPDNPEAFDPRDPYLRVNLDAAIQSGNTITVDWTARVTPQANYSTAGVFVARPVANQSFASGNGPFTVDLRGVAASQETQDPIQYSASSGDTSVVTATVNSYQDTDDNQIPWELELTEQSTGTAAITVTATIDGIGATTDTFEVTIE